MYGIFTMTFNEYPVSTEIYSNISDNRIVYIPNKDVQYIFIFYK